MITDYFFASERRIAQRVECLKVMYSADTEFQINAIYCTAFKLQKPAGILKYKNKNVYKPNMIVAS